VRVEGKAGEGGEAILGAGIFSYSSFFTIQKLFMTELLAWCY
jgi:hypothetical protein